MKKKIMVILTTGLCLFSQAVSVYGADYEYDDLGRVTKVVYEDGSSVTYTYDANGNIVEVFTGTEWEDEVGSSAGDIGAGIASGEAEKDNMAMGDKGSSERNDESGRQSGEKDESDSSEDEKTEENHPEDGKENIEEKENENEGNRMGNVIAGIIAALGIAAILIQRLKNGNWKITDAGQENKEDKKSKDEKAGREAGENSEEGEAE